MLTDRACFLLMVIFAFFVVVSFSEQDSVTSALLSFKAGSDRSNSLSSWVNSSEPCSGSWLGVSCDSGTRRVTRLVLENLRLAGSVQALSQLADLRHLSLKNNSLNSVSPLDLSAWPNLKHLYLSHNRFAGEFPTGVSRLRRIQRIDLSHNTFSGKIPVADLARLPRLLTLRLESNSFDGGLDKLGGNLSHSSPISDFNVSRNNLSGEIPNWLRKFDATSFQMNDKLCGKPLPHDCSNSTDHTQPAEPEQNDRESSSSATVTIVVWATVTALVAVTLALAVLVVYRWRGNRSTWVSREGKSGPSWAHHEDGARMVVFEGCKKGIGGVDELLRASAEMLGKGTVGTTYKVAMDGGDSVAVKRVKIGRLGKEVDWWLRQVLGNLRHQNVVSLRAYHRSQNDDLILFVYDYYPCGSLHQLLHGNRGPGRTPIDWATRLKLASDSARGLAFIHDYSNKFKLFHGHLTSSNILVDISGKACIADVALPQLLRSSASVSPPKSAYTAPELSPPQGTNGGPRKFTQKCDVYSFGVVLLEILTGKMAAVEGETRLVDWVLGVAREEWTWEVLDVELLRHKETEEEIVALMHVATLCVAPSPKDRPVMAAVYRMIEDIRTKGVRDQGGTRSAMDDLTTLAAFSSPSSSDH